MLKFLILVATIAYASAAAVPNGVLPQLDGRIVDGHPTSVSTFPWQISLQRGGRHSCGGSVVNERVIVTAAHCLYGANVTTLRVRAGSSLWFSGGSYVSVAAYKIHEKYSPSTMVNDVAVMRLSDPLKFSSTIKPIKLAQITPANGTLAVVSGWGTTKSGSDTAPSQLKAVNMDIVSREVCDSDIYGYGGEILPSMICTYSVGKDSCQGDSGGPLVSGGVLVGIVSWGYGCALTNLPGVYADVAELHGWLNKTINAI